MSVLEGSLIAAMNAAYQNSGATLEPLLLTAESELLEYSKNLSMSTEYEIGEMRQMIMSKRVELWSQALAAFLQAMAPTVASKVAETVHSYLSTNNKTGYITGSLTAPHGPVVSAGSPSGVIVYP